jgi:DNA repair protein SbcC/Rad50
VQIASLRLENFKSYADTSIEFTPGINAIVGHNGAGKSSILEAIGFVLFDHIPGGYSQANFVKEGARTATITVNLISSLDEREYQIVRRCGGSSQYQVYDPELDKKLCEGKVDAQDFLRQHLGTEADANLSELFSNAVGVPQGMLTSAFLETPARRKPIFDPLLRVEEYKKAFDQLREPGRLLDQRQAQLDVAISALEARLERLPALELSVAALSQSIAEAEQELHTVESTLQHVQQERQALEELRRQIADLLTTVQQAGQQVTNWEVQLRSTEERLAEATNAQNLVDSSRQGHDAYVAAQAQQLVFDEEARRRQSLRDSLALCDKQRSLAVAEQKRLHEALAEIEQAERLVAELSTAVMQQEALETAQRDAERRAVRLADLQAQILRQRRSVDEIQQRLTALRGQLQQVDSIQNLLAQGRQSIDEMQHALDNAREQQGRCTAEADRLKTQIASLQVGDGVRCPVCEQMMDEVHRQDLLARNEKQLVDLRQEWKAVQQETKRLESQIVDARTQADRYEEQLRRLPRSAEVDHITQQLDGARQELEQFDIEAATLSNATDEVEAIGRQLKELGNPRRDQEIATQKIARKGKVTASLEQIADQVEQEDRAIADLQTQLKEYADLDEKMAALTAQLQSHRDAHDTFRRNEQLAESLPRRRQDAQMAEKGFSDARQLLAEKEEAYGQLSASFNEEAYRQFSQQEEQLRSRQGSLKGQLVEQHKRCSEQEQEIELLRERQLELDQARAEHGRLQQQTELLTYLRNILREAGPYVTRALVRQISHEAAQLFGEIMQDYSRRLQWDENYGITLEVDGHERQFAQLSGGEQMSAALAVRLALLREMSAIDVAFFDEPTSNLDETRRESLARQILDIKGFRQLFVISHDDTFEQATENLIRIRKEHGQSVVDYER